MTDIDDGNDAEIFSAFESRERANDENNVEDYFHLPDFGIYHYSLTDVALALAIDAWDDGRADALTDEDLRYAGDVDDPAVRRALVPLIATYLEALQNAVNADLLSVTVRSRSWPDSKPNPSRTYVALQDVIAWLEIHGQQVGDYLHKLGADVGEAPFNLATEIATQRARRRWPVRLPNSASGDIRVDATKALLHELEVAYRRIAQLESGVAHSPFPLGGSSRKDRELKTRPRRTLLAIIAALCKKNGVDPLARGAAAAIASITDEAGIRVSEDTVRTMLADMPDAIEGRTNAAKPNSGK